VGEFLLGLWVARQRFGKSKLSSERVRRLDELGFIWDPFEADWEAGVSHLKLYRDREGHCRVPQSHKENGFRLGQWVSGQRLSRETMSKDRRQRLDELGFVWDQLEVDWGRGFRYKERVGDCRVP
jgi:Helicase associated domain